MNAQTWIVLAVGVALLGIILVGFRNVRIDFARTNDRIDALGVDLRADLGGRIDALGARLDAQTARIDELVVRSHTHDHTSA